MLYLTHALYLAPHLRLPDSLCVCSMASGCELAYIVLSCLGESSHRVNTIWRVLLSRAVPMGTSLGSRSLQMGGSWTSIPPGHGRPSPGEKFTALLHLDAFFLLDEPCNMTSSTCA